MSFFFFFKQKTAYEMLRSLVGSEMCIRDRQRARAEEEIMMLREQLIAKQHGTAQSVVGLQKELSTLSDTCERLRSELRSKTAELDADRRQHAADMEELSERLTRRVQAEVERTMAVRHQKELSSVRTDLEEERRAMMAARGDLDSERAEKKALLDQLDELRAANQQLSSWAAEASRVSDAKFSTREGEYASETQEHVRSISQERKSRESLEAELDAKAEELEGLRLHISSLQAQLRQEMKNSADKIQRLQQEYDALTLSSQSEQASQCELNELVKQLRLQSAEQEIRHEQGLDGLRQQRDGAVEDSRVQQQETLAAVTECRQLKEELESMRQLHERTLASEAFTRQVLENSVQQLEQDKQLLEQRLAEAQAEIRRLSGHLSDEQQRMMSVQAECKQRMAAVQSEMDAYLDQLRANEAELHQIRQELSQARVEIEDCGVVRCELEAEISRLQSAGSAEHDLLLKRLAALQQELSQEQQRSLALRQHHAMYVCVSVYTLHIQLVKISYFRIWREWVADAHLMAGAEELRVITSGVLDENDALRGGEAASTLSVPEFDAYDPNAFDVKSFAAQHFGL
eukprot:TRINITY_DN36238_c0_g1_i3.p1 TRINITY_DN36238_c0_g1~~TRINITY_DN36238_c0_g1_i3.p1  ORF type:complete len:575 (+),score=215.15 TRINITY_DN36238_c0_g1_i3:111-1835(+)